MPLTQNQPWSQVDDELESSAPMSDGTDTIVEIAPAPSRTRRSGAPWHGRIVQSHALIPLAAAVGWTFWGAIHPAARPGADHVHIVVMLTLLALAGGVIVWRRRPNAAPFAGALAHNSAGGEGVRAIHDHLEPILTSVRDQTRTLESQATAALERQQQTAMELSLAETHRRRAEAILESITDPLLSIDVHGQVTQMNAAAAALLGADRTVSLRKAFAEVIQDETLVKAIQQTRDAASRGASRRIDFSSGDHIYCATMSQITPTAQATAAGPPAGGQSPGASGVVVVFRDVTLERQSEKAKSEFVSHVAHELRTPLSSIRAYVEMLVDGEAADETTRAEYYGIIQTATERLGRMIDNMLNISRIESGTVRINKEPVAMAIVVKDALDVVRPQAAEKGLNLAEELTPVAFRVNADRDMIYEAVQNLLSNAIKYTPAGGNVQVRMAVNEADKTISIAVSDTGVGIPKEDLPKMFGKFFRVEANKKVAKGTGLGLNLVKHIVETVHEGKMGLTSEVGQGSTFTMTLPLMDA